MQIYTKDKNNYLTLTAEFFQHCMSQALDDKDLTVISAQLDSSAYDTTTAKAKYSEDGAKLLGIFKYHVIYASNNKTESISLLVKSKISYEAYLNLLASILLKAGVTLASNTLVTLLDQTSLHNNMVKEIKIYQQSLKHKSLQKFLPTAYGTYVNETNQDYIVIEEYLKDVYLMHDYNDLSFWNRATITKAVRDLANFHAIYYDNFAGLLSEGWLGSIPTATHVKKLKPLWLSFAHNLQSYVGNLLTPTDYDQHLELINTIPIYWQEIDGMKKTIIYNDLQIRNIAMRAEGNVPELCLYDWEVATIHLPQRDLVELLCYLITPDMHDHDLEFYLEESRLTLQTAVCQPIDKVEWLRGCLFSLYDYQIDRLALQLNLHKAIKRVDIERVWHASRRLLTLLKRIS